MEIELIWVTYKLQIRFLRKVMFFLLILYVAPPPDGLLVGELHHWLQEGWVSKITG